MSEVKYREFWIDEMTEWFHKSFPEHLTKEPHQHKITHVIEYDALAAKDAEIKALLFRLDWETTTTELVDAHAEIEQLKKRISWLESGSIHTCHAECEKPLCVANREVERLKELRIMNLAGVSTASIQNTRDSIKERITKNNPYWTVAYDDVCRAVDREINLREALGVAKKIAKEAIARIDCSYQCSTNGGWASKCTCGADKKTKELTEALQKINTLTEGK